MKSFEELDVWQKSHALVLEVYGETSRFPKEERFGLVSQVRRATSSVPANIAEGFGRRSTKDFLRYLEIASGSLEETKYFLRLSKDLKYLDEVRYLQLKSDCAEVGRLLGGLIQALRRKLIQV